ncbi:MAG: hypothetical protein M1833_001970 [Piccolia ochrophora]|nr:MAG: hypothetical protein M1833_001970 [Piccolia ochrophora]
MTLQHSDTPHREIRALYDEDTITVYQAYSESIAGPAVKEQRLSASSNFSYFRMTWIKPSWCWMMYRSGYGCKDAGQARILALCMKHEHFQQLLAQAAVTAGQVGGLTAEERAKPVRVQWDPERSPRLGALPHRSIQIGISRSLSQKWAEEWIESIEDVTSKAQALKQGLADNEELKHEELVRMGLLPVERVYRLPNEICTNLGII